MIQQVFCFINMTILLQFAVWLNSVLTKVEEIIQKQGLRKEKTGVIFEGINGIQGKVKSKLT